ncbi:MAG: MOSC domain-containing protein, partial [Pseudomonadota bacterium]
MPEIKHLNQDELEAGLDHIRQAPADGGALEMIVCRPERDARTVLENGELDTETGLLGDNWKDRKHANYDTQLNIMNARATALVAQDKSRWALAG